MKIIYNNCNKDQRRKLQCIVSELRNILPAWLHELSISIFPVYDREPKAKASADCVEQYLRAEIRIHPPFWEGSHNDQLMTLAHEFYHVALSPLYNSAWNIIARAYEHDQKARDLAHGALEYGNERVAEELARNYTKSFDWSK